MKQDRKEKKEIRSILLGRTVLTEDGRLTSPEPGTLLIPRGVVDGAGTVRFFGIKAGARRYQTQTGERELMTAAEQHMRGVGHSLRLREQPDAAACLIRYVLTRPAVLTVRFEEGQPVLTAWSGRGLMGWLSRRRAIGAFERALSEDLRYTGPEKDKTKKKRRKSRKGKPEDVEIPEERRKEAFPEESERPGDGGKYREERPAEEPRTTDEEDGEA